MTFIFPSYILSVFSISILFQRHVTILPMFIKTDTIFLERSQQINDTALNFQLCQGPGWSIKMHWQHAMNEMLSLCTDAI